MRTKPPRFENNSTKTGESATHVSIHALSRLSQECKMYSNNDTKELPKWNAEYRFQHAKKCKKEMQPHNLCSEASFRQDVMITREKYMAFCETLYKNLLTQSRAKTKFLTWHWCGEGQFTITNVREGRPWRSGNNTNNESNLTKQNVRKK